MRSFTPLRYLGEAGPESRRERNDAHCGSIAQGSTVSTPVLRSSPAFQVRMANLRVAAAARMGRRAAITAASLAASAVP